MKTIFKLLAYFIDFISLLFSLPGAALIAIGFLLSDISDTLKHKTF